MLEEIYTYDKKDDTFYVGERLMPLGNFYLYELIGEDGVLSSLTLFHQDYIHETKDKSDYLDYMEKFKALLGEKNDPLEVKKSFPNHDFIWEHLKGQLIKSVYSDEDHWDLSKVTAINSKKVSLEAVDIPLFKTVNDLVIDLSLDNFAMIEIASTQLKLIEKILESHPK